MPFNDRRPAAADAEALELERAREFLEQSDPREHVGELDDRYPILLLPMRIETRFKKIESSSGGVHDELWVRVYPDDIAVDSFEPLLSETEVRNARSFWAAMWKAGGVEADERAAWRALVNAHGAGRAYWIQQQYRPLNEAEKPAKADAADVVLVVETNVPPPAAERSAIVEYWRSVWRAQGDGERLEAAREDLVAAVGDGRAALVAAQLVPVNLGDGPASGRDEARVDVAFMVLPSDDDVDTRRASWSTAPRASVLPERLVLLGFDEDDRDAPAFEAIGAPIPSGLATGPDPSAPAEEQMRPDGAELVVGDAMKWMVDFDEAVAKGMGFRVPLSADRAARGFDRLFVLGVRLGGDESEGRAALETLIEHHHASRKGIGLLAQGTPTNNTERQGAGYSWRDDADESFTRYFENDGADDPAGWFDKKDGRWLAECLGIGTGVIAKLANYHGTDQREARAMNVALWPATLGYFMETMMAPVFGEDVIASTRAFFSRYVSGGGMIPAIRVGRQPYGILPAAPYTRLGWFRRRPGGPSHRAAGPAAGDGYVEALYALLRAIGEDWAALAAHAPYVGKPGDAHQLLLDIVGLHAGSVEHHYRGAKSFAEIHNSLVFRGLDGAFGTWLSTGDYARSGLDLLEKLGYRPEDPEAGTPDVLNKLFLGRADALKGPLIDDVPSSEAAKIRAYTGDGRNYLEWLLDAARESHDALRRQQGFVDDEPPSALLYLMLRHALDLAYLDAGIRLHETAGLFDRGEALAARAEAELIHVQEGDADVGSRWRHLYKLAPEITGSQSLRVAEYIPHIIGARPETFGLEESLAALERLKDAPTARLERAFTEHLDALSYRWDAWLHGLLSYQLAAMRGIAADAGDGGNDDPQTGIYLGAFGWLENVRPEGKVLTRAVLDDPELAAIFADPAHPLLRDPTNGGHVHAPSMNQAVTAAILRNGYLANATPANPSALAVDLSSERVRLALAIVEGIRGGQPLGALLGYQLERGLHDRHDIEVDEFILDLRKAFPLAANKLADTKVEDVESIEQIEARNVVDGLALVEHVESSGSAAYPFGRPDLPAASAAQRSAIDAEVRRVRDIADAVADLAMAESVHQAVQGNYDRAAATLASYSGGHFPPTPDVVRTPRSGVTLTHRVGLHLPTGLDPADPANTTPRAQAEPAVNAWLAGVLPTLADVVCVVEYFDAATGTTKPATVSMEALGLLPIDLLHMAKLDDEQRMTAMDDALAGHVVTTLAPRPDAAIRIRYTERVAGKVNLFELAPLLASLRALIQRSRPLTAADVKPGTAASGADTADVTLAEARITLPRGRLGTLAGDLATFIAALEPLADPGDAAALAAVVDQRIDELAAIFRKLAGFGLPQTGVGFLLEWKRGVYGALRAKIEAAVARFDDKLARFDTALAEYDALAASTPDAERIALLAAAERLVAASTTTPAPAVPADYRSDLAGARRPAYAAKRAALAAILSHDTLTQVFAGIDAAVADLGDYDRIGLDLAAETKQLLIFGRDLLTGARNLCDDLTKRIADVDARLAEHAAAADAPSRVHALLEAAKRMLGQEFRIVPEFGLSEAQADEWQSAYDARESLLDYQRSEDVGEDFPVDSWLYGTARVREKMQHVENAAVLAEAFDRALPALEPVQFPYRAGEPWLALEYPATAPDGEPFRIDEDKLLYTASYGAGFDKTKRQCGLLLDEWSEVVPAENETTGLAFHYDRPSSEPPQALLLAMPADFTGAWRWRDLVDTLHETLDLAKIRAVEPAHVDATSYARFLPAIVSSFTAYPITASLNFALNNRFYLMPSADDE